MLVAASQFSSVLESAPESTFEPGHWRARGALQPVAQGRGTAWFVHAGAEEWVLRHFSRGGLVGRFLSDTYLWIGEARVRAFEELRLTQSLLELGLPVPVPVAAHYRRAGLSYRCDLITRRIPGAAALSARLGEGPLDAARWRAIGAVIGRFHRAGADHADLNAHNILLQPQGGLPQPTAAGSSEGVSLIDFDRGRLRAPGRWQRSNLARLQRSLEKINRALPAGRYDARCWDALMCGYES